MISPEEAARLQRRSLARFLRLLVAGAPDSRLFERRGVAAAIVPSVPQRSIVNSVTYSDAAALGDALEDVAHAYEQAGVVAWTVWAPQDDEAAAEVLAAAGNTLDGRPAAMSLELADFEVPDLGDLDWDSQASGAEICKLNDQAYDWSELEGTTRALRDLKAGPTTHLYRARVDGRTASVAVVIDTDDEASFVLVATDPELRGRGLSTRLMGAALGEARDRGMRTSSLQASAAGEPVYRRLGYQSFGRLHMWEHRST
jgi:GNAT superfamily N-acetyltransferase